MQFSLCTLIFVLSVYQSQGVQVGRLPTLQHRVSGDFYILNSKTLFIDNFNYDGLGPGAYLYYYSPGAVVRASGGGFIIPLSGSAAQRGGQYDGAFATRGFNNEDIMVTLPDGVDACDIGTITVWCKPFKAIFTQLTIPRNIFVGGGSDPCTVINEEGPPGTGPEFDNCEVLHETLQLSWRVDNANSRVKFQLCGCTATDSNTIQYLGFGLSGATDRTRMGGADATIAYVDQNGMAQAKDYFLSTYSQCRVGSGACPDDMDTTQGGRCRDDVSDVSGFVQEGQQCISFARPFNPSDSGTCDKAIDPTQNQYIVWGIGALGVTAFRHHTRATSSDSPIHLGRTPAVNRCSGVQLTCRKCPAFKRPRIVARNDTTFVVVIGPSANPRGYTALTGLPGWGIAWFINRTLIPELVVERGRTYTFLVYGGDNPSDASNYHPFYITNSNSGGRLLNTQQEKATEKVFAGFSSSDFVTTVGTLCEFTENSEAETVRQTCGSYTDYFNRLNFTCRPGEPGKLVWTPDENTPDLVYYQCASHLNLGHGIQVVNEGDPPPPELKPATRTASATFLAGPIALITLALVLSLMLH